MNKENRRTTVKCYESSDKNIAQEIGQKYWEHLNRTTDNSRAGASGRFVPWVGTAFSLVGGISSIVKGSLALKGNTSHPGRCINFTINNYSKYSLVLYKFEGPGTNTTTDAQEYIFPAGRSGVLTINNCEFKRDGGPKFHFVLDDGDDKLWCIVQIGSTTNDNTKGSGQIRLRQIIVVDTKCEDIDGSSNKPNTKLITPVFICNHDNGMSFMLSSPPVSDSYCNLELNFL